MSTKSSVASRKIKVGKGSKSASAAFQSPAASGSGGTHTGGRKTVSKNFTSESDSKWNPIKTASPASAGRKTARKAAAQKSRTRRIEPIKTARAASSGPASSAKKRSKAKAKSAGAKSRAVKRAELKKTSAANKKKSAKSTKTGTTKKTAAKNTKKTVKTRTVKAKTSRRKQNKATEKKSQVLEARVEQMIPSASEDEIQTQQKKENKNSARQAESTPVMMPEASNEDTPKEETKTQPKSESKPEKKQAPQIEKTQPVQPEAAQETPDAKSGHKTSPSAESKPTDEGNQSGVLAPIKKVLRMIRPSDPAEKKSIIAQLSDQERQKLIQAARNKEKANFIDDIDSAVLSDPEPIEAEPEADVTKTITPPQPPSSDLEKNLSGLDVPRPVAANKRTGDDIKKRIRPFVAPSADGRPTSEHETTQVKSSAKPEATHDSLPEPKPDQSAQAGIGADRQDQPVEQAEPRMPKIPEVQREAMREMEAARAQFEELNETKTAVMTAPEETIETIPDQKNRLQEERLDRVNRLLSDSLEKRVDREKEIAPVPEESLPIESDRKEISNRIERREEIQERPVEKAGETAEKSEDRAEIPDELSQLLHKLRSAHEEEEPEEILAPEQDEPVESEKKTLNKITLVRAAEEADPEIEEPAEDQLDEAYAEEEELEAPIEDEPEQEESRPARQWSLDVEIALRELCGNVSLGDNLSFDEMMEIWREDYINYFGESLGDTRYPYIWIDVHSIGKTAREKSHTYLTFTGVSLSGERKILELNEADPRDPESWRNMLRSLERRDLANPRLFIGNPDLPIWEFLPSIFPRAACQFCWNSFLQDILRQFPEENRAEVRKRLEKIRFAETRESADEWIEYFKARFGGTYPRAVSDLLKSRDNLLTYFGFPAKHWNEIKTIGHVDVSYPSDALMDTVFKYERMHEASLFLVFNYLCDSQRKWSRMGQSAKLRAVQNGKLYHNGRRISEKKAEKIRYKTDKNNQSLFDRILIALGLKERPQKPETVDKKLPIKPKVDQKRSAPPKKGQSASAGSASIKDRKTGLEKLLMEKWSGAAKSGGRMKKNTSMKKSSKHAAQEPAAADHQLSGMERELLEELKADKASAGE